MSYGAARLPEQETVSSFTSLAGLNKVDRAALYAKPLERGERRRARSFGVRSMVNRRCHLDRDTCPVNALCFWVAALSAKTLSPCRHLWK